ncbi:unnamed protein product, partial [Porites evermanni]
MGKPRRCSPAFFLEERQALEEKRRKIRMLQQRKVSELSRFKDLPDEVPLPLVIGTKVTEKMSLHNFLWFHLRRHVKNTDFVLHRRFQIPRNSQPYAFISESTLASVYMSGTLGGFPIRFLILVTRLSKILLVKKECIEKLRDMNTQAEKMKSYQEPIDKEFQRRYASVVLELERLNKDLNEYLTGVQEYCQEV